MPFYRKLIIIISNTAFKLLLFFTIGIVAAILIYSNRNYIPSVLEKNNAYGRVVTSLLETNKEQSLTVGGDVTLEDSDVQDLINQSFPKEDIEMHAKNIISASYSWLNQESSKLDFTIDLTSNKEKLAKGLSIFAVNRLAQLPICTEIPTKIDPFSADCQPPYVDYAVEQANLEQQLLSESGFLDETVITADSILGGEDGITFEEKYQQWPKYYSLAKFTPIYILLTLIILALVVIFSSSTRKIGIRKIGRGLIGAGTSIIFFTVVFSFVLPSMTGTLPIFQSSEIGIDALINDIGVNLSRDYSLMVIKLSIPLILTGAIMVIYVNASKNIKNYKSAKLKSGVVSSNEQKTKNKLKSTKKTKPPIQSSEASDTKPRRKIKNKKYRKIPKKEI